MSYHMTLIVEWIRLLCQRFGARSPACSKLFASVKIYVGYSPLLNELPRMFESLLSYSSGSMFLYAIAHSVSWGSFTCGGATT